MFGFDVLGAKYHLPSAIVGYQLPTNGDRRQGSDPNRAIGEQSYDQTIAKRHCSLNFGPARGGAGFGHQSDSQVYQPIRHHKARPLVLDRYCLASEPGGCAKNPTPILVRGHGSEGITQLLNARLDSEVADLRLQTGHIGNQTFLGGAGAQRDRRIQKAMPLKPSEPAPIPVYGDRACRCRPAGRYPARRERGART